MSETTRLVRAFVDQHRAGGPGSPNEEATIDAIEALVTDNDRLRDAVYLAWTVIANAYGGDWNQASARWRDAAIRWRDNSFHPLLPHHQALHSAEETKAES